MKTKLTGIWCRYTALRISFHANWTCMYIKKIRLPFLVKTEVDSQFKKKSNVQYNNWKHRYVLGITHCIDARLFGKLEWNVSESITMDMVDIKTSPFHKHVKCVSSMEFNFSSSSHSSYIFITFYFFFP